MANRREFLKKTAVFTASALVIRSPSLYAQWPADDFAPHLLDEGIANKEIIDTDKIEIKLPKIAEKDAAITITVTSSLEHIQNIAIFVEKNPIPLVAKFNLSPELDAFVSARLKMTETSNVIVLVKTYDGLYRAKEQVKIILGGCGI
ncbi:MAG: thiosulfate oxidation carrier protein SoxY [Methylococcales bacterium]|nr:thiosulfate oxidation carrier protein SoxY [Methylococcales bacterium]